MYLLSLFLHFLLYTLYGHIILSIKSDVSCFKTCVSRVLRVKTSHLVLSLLGLAFVILVETSDTLYRLDIIPICDIIIGLDIFTESHQILVSIEHLHADRGRLPLRTPGPVPLWDLQMFQC